MANYKHTDSGIEFKSVPQLGLNASAGPLGRKNSYVISGDTITNILAKILNAVDINWNGAQVDENTTINTTGLLLSWIKNIETTPGETGADGKSAYELAVEKGYNGTLEAWLNSLKGTPGESFSIYRTYQSIDLMNQDTAVPTGKFVLISNDDVEDPDNAKLYVRTSQGTYNYICDLSGATGITGRSAFQIAQDFGYEGNDENEWLESLKGTPGKDGKDGQDGKSAYELYYESTSDNPKKSQEEWLASLKGADGTMTFDDLTPEQKASLKGEPGADGTTPYIDSETKHWIIGEIDTNIVAEGINGTDGKDGIDGKDGRGISSITEYYLVSSSNSGITRSTSGWTTAILTITSTNKYLWNYEKITYTIGEPTYTTPAIIGVYGDKGADGTSVTISNINENTTSGGTSVITFSNGSSLSIKNGNDGTDGGGSFDPSRLVVDWDGDYKKLYYVDDDNNRNEIGAVMSPITSLLPGSITPNTFAWITGSTIGIDDLNINYTNITGNYGPEFPDHFSQCYYEKYNNRTSLSLGFLKIGDGPIAILLHFDNETNFFRPSYNFLIAADLDPKYDINIIKVPTAIINYEAGKDYLVLILRVRSYIPAKSDDIRERVLLKEEIFEIESKDYTWFRNVDID